MTHEYPLTTNKGTPLKAGTPNKAFNSDAAVGKDE